MKAGRIPSGLAKVFRVGLNTCVKFGNIINVGIANTSQKIFCKEVLLDWTTEIRFC